MRDRIGAKTEAERRWHLVGLDLGLDLAIASQFPLREWEDVRQPGLDRPSSSGPGAPPVISTGDGPRVVRFRTTWISESNQDDLGPLRDKLQALRRIDPRLRRHPLVRLVAPQGTIEGKVAGLRITMVGSWPNGLPHTMRIEMAIEEAGQLYLEQDLQTDLETVRVPMVAGATFEDLARTYYGDPRRGDAIRRENPALAGREDNAGELVTILEADHPRALEPIQPYSLPLAERTSKPEAFAELLGSLARERGGRGKRWEALPEVLAGEVPT